MWYFSWILGTAFAVSFGILNALWHEVRDNKHSHNCAGDSSCQGKKLAQQNN